MFRKILKTGTISLLALSLLAVAGFYGYSVTVKSLTLEKQLQAYKVKELRLENMQKAVMVSYNLTPYEARYYSYIFDDFSQKYNMPWESYPALIRIESNFNSGVMSKDRAKGMTQVIEETAKRQADKLNIPYNDGTLWNCVLNMVIGFDYFSEGFVEKVDSMPRDSALKHAMKRYCGGPGYAKSNPEARVYVKEYKTTVWDEYQRVSYVYKGIMYDQLIASQENKQKEVAVASLYWPIEKIFNVVWTQFISNRSEDQLSLSENKKKGQNAEVIF
jgi:soluble lytic murein transglycosylase-like protein